MNARLRSAGLGDIADKVDAGQRLSFDDGLRLFAAPDLLAVGWLANRERERRHGDRTYFNYNLALEATNVCVATCLFCSFARLKPGDARRPHAVARAGPGQAARSAPISRSPRSTSSTACTRICRSATTRSCCAASSAIRPGIHLKCFTAVEIAFFADLYGKTDEQVLRELHGGRPRLAARRRRRDLRAARAAARSATTSATAPATSPIHRTAHGLGMRTNVTMLYGHIETIDERVDHMLRARALQDETGGFQAFIPLAFHPDNNQMRKLPAPIGHRHAARARGVAADARQHRRTSRRSGSATGVEVAQTALWFGVDDLDGTVQEETIYHMAGSPDAEALSTARHRAADPRRRPRAGRARHALQRRARASAGDGLTCYSRNQTKRAAGGDRRDCSAWSFRARRLRKVSQSRMPRTATRHTTTMTTGTFLPVLTEVESASIRERQPLPERYLGLSDEEMARRIAAASATLGDAPGHPRPSLPARRGDQVRRLHRRLVQARARDRQAPRRRVHRLLRRALHGRERRRPRRAAPAGDPAGPRRRLLDGRHGRARPARDLLARAASSWAWRRSVMPVTYINSSAAIKAFVGEHGGIVCTSSNAAATLKWALGARREDPVPARPAPRPQHRLQDGRAARRDGGVGSERDRSAASTPRGGRAARGCILWKGHCSVHTRFTAQQIDARSRRSIRASASSCIPKCRSTSCRRPTTAARPSTSSRRCARAPAGIDLGRRHRDPPRQPARRRGGARARPCSRSISSAASARRCSACRRTTCSGCSKGWSTARSTTTSSCPTSRSTGRRSRSIGCCRFSSDARVASCRRTIRWLTHFPPLPVRLRRARTAHRRADDADPSRQASPGVRDQPERRAREASRAAREEPRRSAEGHQQRARGHPHRRAQQRRRPREPHDVLDS